MICNGIAIGNNVASCGTAAFLGERVIVADIEHDVRWQNYKDLALTHGLKACWSEPVPAGVGNVVATLAMYYGQVREPSVKDIEVIETMGPLLAHAIMEKRAELALHESNVLHRQAQRMAHLGHWQLDLAQNFLQWSDETYRIFEINPQEVTVTYALFLAVVHPEDRESVNQTYLNSLETHERYQCQHRLLMPDGRIKWVQESCETEFDAQGKALHSLGVVWDITDKRQQQEQLRLLESAVNASNESILITTAAGTIVYTNPAFTRMTGYQKDDVLGKTPSILHSGEQSKEFYQHFWDDLKQGKSWSGRILDRKADGTVFPVYLSVAPIFNENNGELTHYVAVHEDLTQSEAFQKSMNSVQKMQAVGVLAGGIAHDFNNLLAALTGNLYLMKMHNRDNEEIKKRAEVMESGMMKGAKLIQQMLTFARKDHVKMSLLELSDVIKSVSKLVGASLPEDIDYSWDDDGEAWIRGDETQLQQVILNLVTNARHALADVENPQITLRLTHEQPALALLGEHTDRLSEYGWCCIRCSDNGCGIAEENIKHIFEPFFTTREVGLGTGLGLSMTYGAVQSHRGLMDVQSIAGEGTIFSLYFPLQKATVASVEETGNLWVAGRNRGILVVDDNEMLREVLTSVMRYNEFRVWDAEDGAMAVSEYKKYHAEIHLVLMDIVMPNMGGIAAAKQIRQINPNVPIVFFTAYGEEAQRQAAQALEHVQTLDKPVDIEMLLKLLDEEMRDIPED